MNDSLSLLFIHKASSPLNFQELPMPSNNSPKSSLQVEQQRSLIAQSSTLLSETGSLAAAGRRLFSSARSRRRRAELRDGALREAQRVNESSLRAAADNLQLVIEVAEQTQQDELRIGHRHAMDSLATDASSALHRSLNSIFAAKKAHLDGLASMEGDEDLKRVAADYLAAITTAGAEQLIQRNRKPR
ncbi:MAG: hypothetical protein KDA61_21095 [Planctomycetales bacterium]|nr:hypothetical protein [Planctomycetales bacterium]